MLDDCVLLFNHYRRSNLPTSFHILQPNKCTYSKGMLPQHMAALYGHLHVMQWLHTAVAIDINAMTTKHPFVPMRHLAATKGHMAAVKWLVQHSADLQLWFRTVQRASYVAELHGHAAIAAYLHEQEQAADARDRAEQQAAEAAVRRARNEKRRQKRKKGKARRRGGGGIGCRRRKGGRGGGGGTGAGAGGGYGWPEHR